ncbi:MAG: hypothetical protein ACE5HX_05810 [bacterium]
MSEIRLVMNPDSGEVEKIQVIAENEDRQMHTLQQLQVYLAGINQFSKESRRRAMLDKKNRQELGGGNTNG